MANVSREALSFIREKQSALHRYTWSTARITERSSAQTLSLFDSVDGFNLGFEVPPKPFGSTNNRLAFRAQANMLVDEMTWEVFYAPPEGELQTLAQLSTTPQLLYESALGCVQSGILYFKQNDLVFGDQLLASTGPVGDIPWKTCGYYKGKIVFREGKGLLLESHHPWRLLFKYDESWQPVMPVHFRVTLRYPTVSPVTKDLFTGCDLLLPPEGAQ